MTLNETRIRALRVVLFINFLLWAAYGFVDLFFPAYLVSINMGQDSASARHVAAIVVALAIMIWHAFRNPAKYMMVVDAPIVLNVVDLLVGLFQSVNGTELWKNTMGGMILNVVLGTGLVIFRPRGQAVTGRRAVNNDRQVAERPILRERL